MATDVIFDVLARDRASSVFDKVGRSTDRTSSSMQKFGKVAKWAALGAAAGAAVAAKALFGMAKNAMADEAAQRKLAIGIKNATGATDAQVSAVEDWISAQGRLLGVTDDELRPAFQRLVQATGSIDEAQRQMSIAMDVSAGTGKSLKVVTEALMKANNGTTASLSKLGLKTKDVNGETLSLDDALKEMSKTFEGQASSAANTAEGKFERLKIMFDETKESIGAKLIPVAEKLADFMLNKLGPAVRRIAGWLKENLGPAFRAVAEFITDKVIPAAKMFSTWFMDKIAPGLKRTVQPVLEGIRSLFAKIGEKLEENRPQLEKLQTAFKKIAEFIADKVMPVIGVIVGKVGLPLLGKVIGTIIDSVGWLVDKLDWLIDKLGDVKDLIGSIDLTPWDGVLPSFRAAPSGGGSPGGAGTFASARSASGGGEPLIVQLVLDGKVIQQSLLRLQRRDGGLGFV